MWLTALWDHTMPMLQWGAVISASLVAALCDLRTRRIPNMLTAPLLLTGLLCATYLKGLAGLADAAAASLLLGLPYILLFLVGGGAGDAKLMAALGAWLGVLNGTVVLLSVVVSGAVLGFTFAIAEKQVRTVLTNLTRITFSIFVLGLVRTADSEKRHSLPKTSDMRTIPYAIAIFMGVCIAGGGLLLWRG